MKYWKGVGKKQGEYGTSEDYAFVPDSIVCLKAEYDIYVASIPLYEDNKKKYALLSNDGQRIAFIAKLMGLV